MPAGRNLGLDMLIETFAASPSLVMVVASAGSTTCCVEDDGAWIVTCGVKTRAARGKEYAAVTTSTMLTAGTASV